MAASSLSPEVKLAVEVELSQGAMSELGVVAVTYPYRTAAFGGAAQATKLLVDGQRGGWQYRVPSKAVSGQDAATRVSLMTSHELFRTFALACSSSPAATAQLAATPSELREMFEEGLLSMKHTVYQRPDRLISAILQETAHHNVELKNRLQRLDDAFPCVFLETADLTWMFTSAGMSRPADEISMGVAHAVAALLDGEKTRCLYKQMIGKNERLVKLYTELAYLRMKLVFEVPDIKQPDPELGVTHSAASGRAYGAHEASLVARHGAGYDSEDEIRMHSLSRYIERSDGDSEEGPTDRGNAQSNRDETTFGVETTFFWGKSG